MQPELLPLLKGEEYFNQMDIATIDKAIDKLSPVDKQIFARFYTSAVYTSRMLIPEGMYPWVTSQFGSLKDVTTQRVVRLTNKITGEETIFNPLRLKRPHDIKETTCYSLDSFDKCLDSFNHPLQNTPEDTFGRVRGKYCLTASNIAKCDGQHGVVIFNEHHPLRFGEAEVADYIDTAWRWAKSAHRESPTNKYFFYSWNCLWRSAASLIHGHGQVMLTRGRHFARIEHLRKCALAYRRRHKHRYFDDLYLIHRAMGLAHENDGVRVLSYLTPVKNSGIVILGKALDAPFKKTVYRTLSFYRDTLNVVSFNLAIVTPPLSPTRENWDDIPVIAWLADRGSLDNHSCDIGALELFASTAVTSDPFSLAAKMKAFIPEKRGGHHPTTTKTEAISQCILQDQAL